MFSNALKPNKTLLLAILAVILSGLGCRKNDITDSITSDVKKINPLAAKNETTRWIDLHIAASQSESQSYDLLKQNLNYEEAHVQKRKNGEEVLVIPVNNTMREKLKLNANYALKMITVKRNGKPRWSMIVCFLAGQGKTKSILEDKSIKGIVDNERLEEDGLYKFFDLKGRLLYQVSYKNKKITSYGTVRKKDKSSPEGNGKVMSMNRGWNNAKMLLPPTEDCTDYYLVTTYYDENGNTLYETWEYLFTTCNDGGGGDGGDGDGDIGGGTTPPEDPVDVEMTQEFEFTIPYTDFQPDDYQLPGGSLTATPEATPLDYDCKVTVTFASISRKISGVATVPLVVHPAHETYLHDEWGTVTRNVTPIPLFHNATFAGRQVSAVWDYEINFRWSYLNYGTVRTIQIPFYHSTTFMF